MNDLLKRESTVKVISILFAVFLWFFVLDSTNPVISTDINVPLRVENESVLKDNGIVIKNKNFPRNVTISVKGRKDKISLFNSNDAEAVIDLSKVNDVNVKFLYVEVYNVKEGVSFEGVTPRVIDLELERIGENPFPVEVISSGKVKENYKVVGVSVSPETVSIEATDSIIKSIEGVKVFADIEGLNGDLEIKRECKVYNKDGDEIPELSDRISVDIKVEIAKEVPIVPVVKGKPAKDYVDGVHKAAPDKALISGPSEVTELVDNLMTEPIDIENLSKDTTKMTNIVLPKGIRLVNTPRSVYVNVAIEPLAVKEFSFDADEIELENELIDGSLRYRFQNEKINISITGISQELDKIFKSSIKPSIDVRGLGEGTYTRTLEVILPSTVHLIENYEVQIIIEKNEE